MRKLLLALAFITLNSTVSTQAETYPSRHITLVAPVAAGGPLDVNARLIATALGDVLGQQVIVENRTGAGTAVGTASVARAAPDGYTLLIADMTFVAGPELSCESQLRSAARFCAGCLPEPFKHVASCKSHLLGQNRF